MTSARHYWNTVHSLISIPIERQLLKEPIKNILKCISKVEKNIFSEEVGLFI